ncbi:hypothetical protein Syun_002157 [Stephania yunnanensis]|uniref:Uncharacterized protein n=1 Tax=Stephania yunnanensis TaxID=152371 RepID=A0AAP0Q6Y0_9MAGN
MVSSCRLCSSICRSSRLSVSLSVVSPSLSRSRLSLLSPVTALSVFSLCSLRSSSNPRVPSRLRQRICPCDAGALASAISPSLMLRDLLQVTRLLDQRYCCAVSHRSLRLGLEKKGTRAAVAFGNEVRTANIGRRILRHYSGVSPVAGSYGLPPTPARRALFILKKSLSLMSNGVPV